MSASNLRQAIADWHGPLGKWLQSELTKEANSALKSGAEIVPENLRDQNQREHLLAKHNALIEALELIPTRLKLQLKEQEITSNE